jgi:hypothetical protein
LDFRIAPHAFPASREAGDLRLQRGDMNLDLTEPILKKEWAFYFEITICDFKIAYFRV